MRLLFDQNISFRLIRKISDIFPEAKQVRQLNLENATDRDIWDFAKLHDYSIVTFDSDFFDLSVILGHPPKIIWIRTDNTTTKNLEKFLRRNKNLIEDFIKEIDIKEVSCLELYEE